MLHLIGVSPLNSELPFLVFDESSSEHLLLDCSDNNFFCDRRRMGLGIHYCIYTEQGPRTKFALGTSNGMGFALQLPQFSSCSRLQVFRCELFELLFVIGSTNSKHYILLVRFRLPSYSVVSLFIRGIRCEWIIMKQINYWVWPSRSTSSSALATIAIS